MAAALLVITGLIMLADFKSSGAASCAPAAGPAVGVFAAGTSCEPVVGAFSSRWLSLTQTTSLALMTLPVLLGVFIAAPLLSREFEQRTHLFAWSQSITKLRWVLVKLGLFAAVVLISAAALTVLVTWKVPQSRSTRSLACGLIAKIVWMPNSWRARPTWVNTGRALNCCSRLRAVGRLGLKMLWRST